MEQSDTPNDPHGFALAVPLLFQRLLVKQGRGRLEIFTASSPTALTPSQYGQYTRTGGRAYWLEPPLQAARRSSAKEVSLLLLTDGEDHGKALDLQQIQSLGAQIKFSCVILKRKIPEICKGRAVSAQSGLGLMKAMASHLARSMESLPKWGSLSPQSPTISIQVGRLVRAVHVMLVGQSSGISFKAQLQDEQGRLYSEPVEQTRQMLRGPLYLQTLSAAHDPKRADEWLLSLLPGAEGEVVYGIILEYDLGLELITPAQVGLFDGKFELRAHLLHHSSKTHAQAQEFIDYYQLQPSLELKENGQERSIPMHFDASGWARLELEPKALGLISMRANLTGTQVALRSPLEQTEVLSHLSLKLKPLPSQVLLRKGKIDTEAILLHKGQPVPTDFLKRHRLRLNLEAQYRCERKACPPVRLPMELEKGVQVPFSDAGQLRLQAHLKGDGLQIHSDERETEIIHLPWASPKLDLQDWVFEQREMRLSLKALDGEQREPLSEQELISSGVELELIIDGTPQHLPRQGNHFELRFNTGAPRQAQLYLRIRSPKGRIEGPIHTLEVVPDAYVRLPPILDFGPLRSGCQAEAHCQTLDFGGSQSLEGLLLRVERLSGWSDLELQLLHEQRSEQLEVGSTLDLRYQSALPLQICYRAPDCQRPPEEPSAFLKISPIDPRLQDPQRAGQSLMSAQVKANTWWECHLWWLLLLNGALMLLLWIYGLTSPAAFSSSAMLRVANKESMLRRDPGRPLRSLPGGRRGFYREARCCFDPSGYTPSCRRGHILQLRAEVGYQIRVISRGSQIERRSRGRWIDISKGTEGAERLLMPNAIYRVNQAFFFELSL